MQKTVGKSIYFLSGIGTWRAGNLFGGAMEEAVNRYRSAGVRSVHAMDVYPYGTMDGLSGRAFDRFLAYQALQVSRDMFARYNRSGGARRAFRVIVEDYETRGGGDVVLIGHSGGGVAAYGAGKLLSDRGYNVESVIMVGSPEHWIAKDWQGRVRSLRKAGRFGDLVTWWGRPCPGKARTCEEVNIVGGHPDYFRRDISDDQGVSNLSKVMDKIWDWLRPPTPIR